MVIDAALEALTPELVRLDLLIHREILRLRARYELSLDEFRGLYISDQQVDELLAAAHSTRPVDLSALTREADAMLQQVTLAEQTAPVAPPWRQLATTLKLSRAQRDLTLMVLAPEIDTKYETLYAYLNNDVTRKLPTLELAGRLFGANLQARVALRGLLTPDSLLTRLGVVEAAPTTRELPRGQRGLRLAPPLVDWLLGLPYVDERLDGIAKLVARVTEWPYPSANEASERMVSLASRLVTGQTLPLVVCLAPTATEAAAAATTLFGQAGRDCLALDLTALAVNSNPMQAASAVDLMAAVLGVGIVASPVDALFDGEGHLATTPTAALRHLCANQIHIALAASMGVRVNAVLPPDARSVEIRLPELDVGARASVWRRELGPHASGVDVDAIADRFSLGANLIRHAAQIAMDTALLRDGPLVNADLLAAARTVSGQGGHAVTRSVATELDWEDLILPPLAQQRLQDLLNTVALRPRVLDEWGFGRRLNGARGVRAMFSGVSGTGKTMAASLVARKLGLDIHRIELAAVVSKYIGETEKNLDRAFDIARRTNAILFIDEADALFGKRSEVKDAHDRYANVEISYLLQKMEDHDGVVILATNLAKNIDEAFSRRMQFVIDFPVPDAASREQLWRGMFPVAAPLADDVDIPFLARQFEFSGGDIRNVVLESAYLAAQDNSAISMHHLLNSVARQYTKSGKVPTPAEFREYYAVLSQGRSEACASAL